jgi:hypothetical protein
MARVILCNSLGETAWADGMSFDGESRASYFIYAVQ